MDYYSRINLIKLKIKAKSLAEEAKIIRKEERKLLDIPKNSEYAISETELTFHRKWDVRNEARATQLAIAYLKGKKYKDVERKIHDRELLLVYIFPRVFKMIQKYGDGKIKQFDLKKWFELN